MADAARTAVAFEGLQLHSFPEDWIKKCWDEDFVDLITPPLELDDLFKETDYLTNELQILSEVLSVWVESNNLNEDEEGFWTVLVENNIPHKTLVVLLAFLFHNASKVSITFTERLSGTQAASIYLKLAALPGSSAFKIFHPELFLQACRLLNKWNKRDCEGPGQRKRRRSSSSFRSSQSQKGKRRKGGKRRSNDSSQESFEEDGDDEEDSFTEEEFMKLDFSMRQLLSDVLIMCEKFSLRQSESTAAQLMSLLISLTRLAPESVAESMGQWDSPRCSVGMLSYKAMYLLCQPFHGHVISMVNESCKLLLNHILMMEDGKVYQNLLRPIVLLKQQAVAFILYLAKELGDRCLPCVKTLLQHICFKVPDKSDYRAQVAQAVYDLLTVLPDGEYASFLEWLKKFSKHKKVSHRSFSIDIMVSLMEKPERQLTDVPEELASFTAHKSMVCTLLSRCSDSHASVRSRALVAFSQCTNSKHVGVLSTIKEVITPVAFQGRPPAKHFMPTPFANIAGGDSEKETTENFSSAESATSSLVRKDSEISENQENVPSEDSAKTNIQSATGTPQGARDGRFLMTIALTPSFNPYLPDTEGVVSMIRRRALDMKVVVRKSALQALQQVIRFEAPSFSQEDLSILQERCADPALSVRKQAIQSLFELLETFPHNQQIQKAWIFGLLPQVMDKETSVQEKCFDTLEEMIICNLKPLGRLSTTGIEWHILSIIANEHNEKLRRYLQKACQYWARTKKLKPSIVTAVQSHVMTERDNTAWMFLAEIAKTSAKLDHDFVVDQWLSRCKAVIDPEGCGKWSNVLFIIAACAKSISRETITKLLDDLKHRLLQFSHPPAIIAAMVNTVSKLTGHLKADAPQRTVQAWGENLMSACDKYMSQIILNSTENKGYVEDEEKLILYMFTLGEVCQRCPSRIPKRVTLLIQSIIAAPCIGDTGTDTPASSQAGHDSSGESSQSSNAIEKGQEQTEEASQETQDSQGSESKGSMVSSQSQSQQSQAGSTQSTQPLSQFRGSNMSSKLRAHAFITLGKLCLIDETLAKKSVAALARELEESESPAVRNNVVIVMGDLTVRYTTLVDRYITNIAACLKDPAALVRKNTLTVLTRLLQEEYVKWKGVLFFRYITTLLDENEEIKSLAEFCLEHLLLKKHPNMFFHPFIECIFHFNHYTRHPVYNKFKQTEGEKCKFTLAGSRHTSRRMHLYTFMLEHMTDEQRFKTTAKICKEILSTIVEQTIPLDDEGSLLLRDALDILSSKEIKLSSLKNKGTEDGGEEGTNVTQIVTAAAKKVLITQVVKRNVIENIVPVVISLKHMLEKKCSPILKNLMGYLRELMKDYKSDVKDILSADRQLAEEIEFDLKNFEKQQAEKEAAASHPTSNTSSPRASKAATPVALSPQSSRGPSLATSPSSKDAVAQRGERVLAEASKLLNKTPVEMEDILDQDVQSVQRRLSSKMISQATKRAISRTEERRGKDLRRSILERAQKEMSQRQTGSVNFSSSCQSSPSRSENTVLTPKASNRGRAISTPSRDLYNITFRGDVDVSMCPPPSPIPSVASAASGGHLCMSPQVKVQKVGNKDVLSMPHPSSKDPEPSKWNIQSPTTKKKSTESKDTQGTPTRKSYESERVGLRKSSRNRKL